MKANKNELNRKCFKLSPNIETDTLLKYHQAAQSYSPTLPIMICLYMNIDGELMPSYQAFSEDDFKQNEQHYFNLLYLITLLKNWDYAHIVNEIYGDVSQTTSEDKTLQDEASYHLQTLLSFLKLASDSTKDLSLTVNGKSEGKILQGKLHSRQLIRSIVETTIHQLFTDCKISNNDYLRYLLRNIETPNIENIEPIAEVQNFLPKYKIDTTFRRLVVLKIREYLNHETNFKQDGSEALSREQAKIIYALLAQTLLIPVERVKDHKTERRRVAFVRSIISSPVNNKRNSKTGGNVDKFPEIQIIIDEEEINLLMNEKPY